MRTVLRTANRPTERIRELFEAASAERGAAREALLRRESDAELRATVERMLEADALPHALLDQPLGTEAALEAGHRVGPYQILRGIASGGMGAVYLAQTAEQPAGSLVALKIVRGFSSEFLRRFQQERQILTSLQHPHIARLLDAGTTPEGHPYFAMEYVDGAPLDSYCVQKQLSTRDRVRLFRQICAAVHYLHQNLVVHRDLKPGNVLVTSDGSVRLLDFGIAKWLSSPQDKAANTTTALMTPGYASPEQVKGLPTSTLTDVYGLGILLYEILTGARPFAAANGEPYEVLRRICEQEPHGPGINAELDNIVRKAIRKEPERRYVSVEQFDEDLRRYLDGLPVLAQGDSVAYRLRKFAGRHKAGIGAAATMVILLAGGVVATLFEAREAQRAMTLAEAHARSAEDEKKRADAAAAVALRERGNAARRLAELQKLARGTVGIYTSGSGDRKQIAEATRDSLLVLQKEGIYEPGSAELSARAANDVESYLLGVNSRWSVPFGWQAAETVAGEYQVGTDNRMAHGGKSSLFLRAVTAHPTGSVRVGQAFSAARYRGHRVRVSGFFRTGKIDGNAYLRLITESSVGRAELSDAGQWKNFPIVIDIAKDAENIGLEIWLQGAGTLWADDLVFEEVPLTIPPTVGKQPTNLKFDLR